MSVLAYSLLSLAELKSHLVVSSTGEDARLEAVINDTTADLENYLQRQVVTRGVDIVEYHTMRIDVRDVCTSELRPRQWPIISISEVCEDISNWPRTYPVASRLTADVDYQIVHTERDYLRRLSTGFGVRAWAIGIRPIRLTYRAGYADTASVPLHIKTQAKKYAALLWREIDRKIQGVQTQNDGLGNFTRFAEAGITDQMREVLADECRNALFETGESST